MANNFKVAKVHNNNNNRLSSSKDKNDSNLKFDINSPSVFDQNVKLRRRDASENNKSSPYKERTPILNFRKKIDTSPI